VTGSTLEQLLAAIDGLDVEAVMALVGPEPRFLAADGRRAAGAEEVRELLTELLAALRSTTHRITAEWHVDDVWIAEVDADFELQDFLELKALPRVFILRTADGRIADLRVYGAHEHPLTDHRTGEEGMWIGMRWVPPL
jgi:ketosteroid isomerase-like protein